MKKWGIIGALVIVAAVALGYFFDYPAENIVTIAVSAFGLTGVIIGAVKDARKDRVKTWPVYICIVAAIVGGGLCCIGGCAQSIFMELAGATLALLSVIFGLIFNKK